ncbi:MAG TPA: response regulator, partial [Candidatus Obscuribacterales bacterium]
KLGYKPDIATNGKEAVQAVQQKNNYALILMDWQMPIMDGIEATLAIRGLDSQNAHSVPIVACTAHIMPEDRLTCLKAGMNDYLSKPVSLEALQTVTERWVPRARTNAA